MTRTATLASLILAVNLAGCGGGGAATVAAPSELKAEALSGGAHLSWKDNSNNETEFMIERKTGTGSFATIKTVPFDTTQYHDTPLTSGTTYVYRVNAMGASGHSAASTSNEVTFTAP